MSVFRQPEVFDDRSGTHVRAGRIGEFCSERMTERGDTWEMSMFNTARKEWAGDDPVRLKQMAAMFLAVGCDWEYDAVAMALGYSGRQPAHKAAQVAMAGVRSVMAV